MWQQSIQHNRQVCEKSKEEPAYVKYLKDMLTKKEKILDFGIVEIATKCFAVLQNKLPQKLKDPGGFTIPIIMVNVRFDGVLCDLGSAVNLIHFSAYKRLNIVELKPTAMTLQMADRSIKYPRGTIDDVLIKVDKFYFPVDFVILDMEEGYTTPILLGRSFLNIAMTLIDVNAGGITFMVNNEAIVFNIFDTMKKPQERPSECYFLDMLDEVIASAVERHVLKDPLEECLSMGPVNEFSSHETNAAVYQLNANFLQRKIWDRKTIPLKLLNKLLKPSIEEPPRDLELKPLSRCCSMMCTLPWQPWMISVSLNEP